MLQIFATKMAKKKKKIRAQMESYTPLQYAHVLP